MTSVSKRISRLALVAALSLASFAADTPPKQPHWQSQAEFDMYTAVQKATDPHQKLAALDAWKEKFPNTEFHLQRLALYLTTYQQLNDVPHLVDTLNAMLVLNPKDLQVMNGIMFYMMQEPKPDAAALDNAQKVANAALANLDVKPAGVAEAQWPAFRKNVEALAHTTLGWAAVNRKDTHTAETEFAKALQIEPNLGKVDLLLADALWADKTPESVSKALFYYARAATYDGEGAPLPAPARQQVGEFLRKAYTSYHGPDDAGLDALRKLARSQPAPPDGFTVLSAQQVAVQKQQDLQKQNPQLALWMSLKQTLTSPTGQQFFDSSMKGAEVPGGAQGVQTFKGTLISASPAVRPKELVVGISDPKTPEVTLKLDSPLPGKPVVGSELEFEGVPVAYAADPFNITFTVERSKLKDLQVQPAPTRRATRRR